MFIGYSHFWFTFGFHIAHSYFPYKETQRSLVSDSLCQWFTLMQMTTHSLLFTFFFIFCKSYKDPRTSLRSKQRCSWNFWMDSMWNVDLLFTHSHSCEYFCCVYNNDDHFWHNLWLNLWFSSLFKKFTLPILYL